MDADTNKGTLERLSDAVTNALGSTLSVVVHPALFVGIFGLRFMDVSMDEILLVLTTALSLEAIYLSVFIQRSANRQAERLDAAMDEVRHNTHETLVRLSDLTRQEIDDVQAAVERIENKIEEVARRTEAVQPRRERDAAESGRLDRA